MALACAAATAGCGLGAGEEIGDAELTVTRDYGEEVIEQTGPESIRESDTVMRVLDRNVEIETRYGGGFVQEIEGIAGGAFEDWFFYVNGVESGVGAAQYELKADERLWWDFHDWSAVRRVPAVVGAWPEPFAHGYEGRRRATALSCLGSAAPGCEQAEDALDAAGARLDPDAAEAIRMLVGPWALVGRDAAAALIAAGPKLSGVFARFEEGRGEDRLVLLDSEAEPVRELDRGGLVAATRLGPRSPTWVVTGTDPASVRRAASLLDEQALAHRFAVAVTAGGRTIPLPVP